MAMDPGIPEPSPGPSGSQGLGAESGTCGIGVLLSHLTGEPPEAGLALRLFLAPWSLACHDCPLLHEVD